MIKFDLEAIGMHISTKLSDMTVYAPWRVTNSSHLIDGPNRDMYVVTNIS